MMFSCLCSAADHQQRVFSLCYADVLLLLLLKIEWEEGEREKIERSGVSEREKGSLFWNETRETHRRK